MTLLSKVVMAFALIGLLTVAAPPAWTEAQAQSKAAKDLKCKGCVGKKDIAKKAVKMKALDKKLQNKLDQLMMDANRAPFSAKIAANSTVDILTLGTFVLFAQCLINSGGDDRINLFIRNTANGWFHPFQSGPLTTATEICLGTLFVASGVQILQTLEVPGGLDPFGFFIGLMHIGLGLNILNNACVVYGTAGYGQVE